jgi:hypothetical protein
MSARDDQVWREIVDDARVRGHEVRQCETAGAPLADARIAGIAAAAVGPARRPRRNLAAALLVASVASSLAAVGAAVVWPQVVTTLSDDELAQALQSTDEELQDRSVRARLLPVLVNDVRHGASLLRELETDAELGADARAGAAEVLAALAAPVPQRSAFHADPHFIPACLQAKDGSARADERRAALQVVIRVATTAVHQLRRMRIAGGDPEEIARIDTPLDRVRRDVETLSRPSSSSPRTTVR